MEVKYENIDTLFLINSVHSVGMCSTKICTLKRFLGKQIHELYAVVKECEPVIASCP